MKRLSFGFFILLSAISASIIAHAAEYILTSNPKVIEVATTTPVFERTIGIGSSGADVAALRKVLSLELGLSLGSGSNFDQTLKNAVKQLQEKYPVEILIPQGISAGTGLLDALTINKLNQLAAKYNVRIADFAASITTNTAGPRVFFTRDLFLGSTGDDVALLKTVLNSDSGTQLVYAPGQVKQENLFDAQTANAVKRFQEKYASEILAPAGLTVGTGSVGATTRKKLNAIVNVLLPNQTTTSTGGTDQKVEGPYSLNYLRQSGTNVSNADNQYLCSADTYSCSEWSSCVNGTQTRTCSLVFDCRNDFAPAITSQACFASQTSGTSQNCTNQAQVALDAAEAQERSAQSEFNRAKSRVQSTLEQLASSPYNSDYLKQLQSSQRDLLQAQVALDQAKSRVQQAKSQLRSGTSCISGSVIPVGTVISEGHVDICELPARASCTIVAGRAQCENNAIICPAKSQLRQDGSTTDIQPASYCNSQGARNRFWDEWQTNGRTFSNSGQATNEPTATTTRVQHNAYSCVTTEEIPNPSQNSNPIAAFNTYTTGQSASGGIIGAIGNAVGSVVSGALDVVAAPFKFIGGLFGL